MIAALQILVRSYGFGIFQVDLLPTPVNRTRPNGNKDVQQSEVFRRLQKTGMAFTEVILDVDDESRAFAISPEGHEPTKYELSQISEDDWESIRTAVDMWGSQAFSDRLTMLESAKPRPSALLQSSP